MENIILVALIGAVAGLVSGAIASLIAPWIKWGIEKKKLKLSERKQLLKDVRKIIITEYDKHEKFTEQLAVDPDSLKKTMFIRKLCHTLIFCKNIPNFKELFNSLIPQLKKD